jgi:energy-coupling factor transporter ATP-binding protein EcfA2
MNTDPAFPVENPFCTRRIRPGALPYLFPPGKDLETILKRLRGAAGWGEIIGPHGSGKSTLLAGLIPLLQAEGWQVERIDLHDGQRRLPVDLRQIPETETPLLLVVDGYEQLGSLSRFHLKRHCRRRGWGLIVTAHRSAGLPELCNTAATLEQANRVVEELLKNSEYTVSRQDIADRYARCQGNLREMLFELYDLFERRRTS